MSDTLVDSPFWDDDNPFDKAAKEQPIKELTEEEIQAFAESLDADLEDDI